MNRPLAQRLSDQARACDQLRSPLYAALLDAAAKDLLAGGPTARILAGYENEPPGSALGLRLLAALHRQVLLDRAPELAAHYPSVGGTAGVRGAWEAARQLLLARGAEIRADVARPCQTNDPGRSVPLLAGLLELSRRFDGMPLRLLEIGASGGLNLWPDAYRIGSFGPPDAPPLATKPWDGSPPAPAPVDIVDRAGCDLHPVDPRTVDGRLTLEANVWADQTERLDRLRLGFAAVRDRPFLVARATASQWLATRLAQLVQGVVTVVWHSVVWQYVLPEERVAIAAALSAAARHAGSATPLARLSMEPERRTAHIAFAVRLTTWPGGSTAHLADTHGHGVPVRLMSD